MCRIFLAFAFFFCTLVPLSAQSFQVLSPKDVDIRLDNQLYETLKLGTTLYNQGSGDACIRIYQGSLILALGFLDHRPDQQEQVRKALKDIETMTNTSERAFALRKSIDDLRASFRTPAALWDRLGGESAISPLLDDFIKRTVDDPKVNFSRKGSGRQWEANPDQVGLLKKHLLGFISARTGGPLRFEGRDLKALHLGMNITGAEFQAMIDDLKLSLEKFAIATKDQDQLLQIFHATRPDVVTSLGGRSLQRSLWDRLGGEDGVTRIVDDLFDRALADPLLNFRRQGKEKQWDPSPENIKQVKRRMVELVSSLTGGPLKYRGPDLKTLHTGMQITDEEFKLLAAEVKTTLDKFKVPDKEQEELFKIIAGAKENIVEKK
jgi:hemoglobin